MVFEHQTPTTEKLKELIRKSRMTQIEEKLAGFSNLPYTLQTKDYYNLLLRNKIGVADQDLTGFIFKFYLPVKEFPKINFTGLILGVNGDTLRQIEQETRSRIYIKGLGTEPVHCHIISDDTVSLRRAINLLTGIVEEAIFSNRTPQTERAVSVKKELSDWEKFYMWWYYYNVTLKKK